MKKEKLLIKFNKPNLNGDIFTKDTEILLWDVIIMNGRNYTLYKKEDGIYIKEIPFDYTTTENDK